MRARGCLFSFVWGQPDDRQLKRSRPTSFGAMRVAEIIGGSENITAWQPPDGCQTVFFDELCTLKAKRWDQLIFLGSFTGWWLTGPTELQQPPGTCPASRWDGSNFTRSQSACFWRLRHKPQFISFVWRVVVLGIMSSGDETRRDIDLRWTN